MFSKPPPAADPSASKALRVEIAALDRRLARVETLLAALYEPSALGGPPPVARETDAAQPRLRPVGVLPGGGSVAVQTP
jgi:hypothetical protein